MPGAAQSQKSAPAGALYLLVALAGLAGATGVALAAVAAHRVDSPGLATAATMLMIHAAAVVAIASVGFTARHAVRAWLLTGGVMLAGVAMFSGAIALSTLAEVSVPNLAPSGGMIVIASWLGVAVLAVHSATRRGKH
jgi:uncharacterized membrane protein YgdD (TMEM256/DUF423 family)